MADSFASTFDKFGASAPRAPDAQGSGPSANAAPFVAVCPPAPAHWENKSEQLGDKPADNAQERLEEKREQLQQSKPFENNLQENRPPEAPRSFHGFKPVEVMSVPQTPVNGSTPAGASPRPELKINEEPSAPPEPPYEPVIEPIEKPETDKPASTASMLPNEPPAPAPPAKEPLVLTGTEEPKPASVKTIPTKKPAPASVADQDGDTVMNGAPKLSEPEKPAVPVTHAGPAADPVPAPAPAPAAAPVSEPAPMPEAAKPSEPAPAEPSIGEKRKLEEQPAPASSAPLGGFAPEPVKPFAAEKASEPDSGPFEKKAKLDGALAELGGGISKPEPAAAPPKPSIFESAPAAAAPAPAATMEKPSDPIPAPKATATPAAPEPAKTEVPISAPAPTAAPVAEPSAAAPPVKAPALDATDSATKPEAAPKPKKEKKLPAVGRTQRKTRSQGPVDA